MNYKIVHNFQKTLVYITIVDMVLEKLKNAHSVHLKVIKWNTQIQNETFAKMKKLF